MRFLPRRIAPRLILAVTVLVALGCAISAYISATDLERQLKEEKITAADQLSRSITSATWHAMQAGRKEDAYEVMEAIASQHGVRAIRMFNRLGKLAFTTDPTSPPEEQLESHACQVCHRVDPPLVATSAAERARFLDEEDGGHTLDMVTAFFNEPSCSTADCHAHDPDKKVLGVLDLALDLGHIDDEFRRMQWRAAGFAFLKVILIGGFLAFFISRSIGRPIRRLIRGTRAIASMDLDHPLKIETTTELGDLADSFEQMRQRLREAHDQSVRFTGQLEEQVEARSRELQATQQRLVQSDRLASLGQLAASVAHEVNNPISAVHNLAIFLQRILGEDGVAPERLTAFRRHLGQIADESARAGRIVQDLLSFSRRSTPQRALADLNGIVRATMEIVGHRVELAGIELVLELSPHVPPVSCDRSQIEQVIMNLSLNAVEAMKEGGRLIIRTGTETAADMVVLQVEDTGPGIPKAHLAKVFDPFFSTKQGEKGVGLGLSVAYGIVEAHAGRLSVRSEEGRGTTFTVRLPLHPPDGPPPTPFPRKP